jgi:hypothetical protein
MAPLPPVLTPATAHPGADVSPFVLLEVTDTGGIAVPDLRAALMRETLAKGEGRWDDVRENFFAPGSTNTSASPPDWCCAGERVWCATMQASGAVVQVYLGARSVNGVRADVPSTAAATGAVITRAVEHYRRVVRRRPQWQGEVYVNGSSTQITLKQRRGLMRCLIDPSAWTTGAMALGGALAGVAQAGKDAVAVLKSPTSLVLLAIGVVCWGIGGLIVFARQRPTWHLVGWERQP